MSDNSYKKVVESRKRPLFSKRVIITAGMPYGNKDLHFGHIGAIFVPADIFARFLRDRIGRENVIFISGTDCYGSPIMEDYRLLVEKGVFKGTIQDFVIQNHNKQVEALKAYNINCNLFAASSFGRSAEIHRQICAQIFSTLYENGHLLKMTSQQFYDKDFETFLNGRQVVGSCPILGCSSEKGYADECSLGHQYREIDLIDPKSTLSGKKPEMRDVSNWYFNLPGFLDSLKHWVDSLIALPGCREFVTKSFYEFLEPPALYVKKNQLDLLESILNRLPEHTQTEGTDKSILLIFKKLEQREKACTLLAEHAIRYRTGKTLVPFRLTGNIEWGVPVPVLEDLNGLTFWVWPESLWAPLSFTATYLEQEGKSADDWKAWWTSGDTEIYQFIGEDNLYFYGIAEMAMFMGMRGKGTAVNPGEDDIRLPELIVNKHLLFLDKKASSSGKIKPPMARDLLKFYTADQLRAHFFSLGLSIRSVGIKPKPLDPKASEKSGDPVLKEGNLLCNVFNRAVRTCFYTMQTYFNGKIPVGDITVGVLEQSATAVLDFEEAMFKHEFHKAMAVLDNYIRGINKYWESSIRIVKENDDELVRKQALIDTFHMVRTATVLLHPIAPTGTEMIREYLNVGEEFFQWEYIFEPLYYFIKDPENHEFKFLESRVDFFEKHPDQVKH
ncbi:MAG: class I tRNA ligase family protein [Spirochaetales bacterium]|nr:class I tRNA ligase family protein [Spirochaetales bacterium]